MTERDAGFIRFLIVNRHGTPFEHRAFRFLVKAPMFVARERLRHRAGTYNECSRRYSKMEPEFYVPDNVRTQVGKPGAYSFEPVDAATRDAAREEIEGNDARVRRVRRMLEHGVAKEVARIVLPLSMYTKFLWS